MEQSGVDHGTTFGLFEQVINVTKVAMAQADTIAGTVLVQYNQLTGRKPSLKIVLITCVNYLY